MGLINQRTCVSCKGVCDKNILLRFVKVEDNIKVDVEGGAVGRGAYVHKKLKCIFAAGTAKKIYLSLNKSAKKSVSSKKVLSLNFEDLNSYIRILTEAGLEDINNIISEFTSAIGDKGSSYHNNIKKFI